MGSESSLAAWALVLARVPIKRRFCTACLVSNGLRSAAFAATSVLELKKLRGQHADAFAAFLRKHGRRLSVLKVSCRSGSPTVPAFECHSLQRLQLAGCTVQLQQPPDNLLASATQLTLLELAQVTVQGPEDSLSALAALPELQHLALQGVKMHSPDTPTGSRPLRLPGAALQALTGLTGLCISSGPFLAHGALQHLSCLTKLQHLALHNALSTPLSPASAPGFSALTALTSCSLYGGSVDPTVLLSCTNLLQLRLRHLNQNNGAVADGATLLQLLSTLPSLQHLEVADSCFSWPQDPEALTAFTVSSALRQLQLEDCGLPPGIWQRAFPEGRQLCQLQKLLALEGQGDKPAADGDGVLLRDASLSSADIVSISSCCRALEQLAVTLQPDVSLSVLTTLTGLTTLEVYGISAATIDSLAGVTTLQDMNLTLRKGVRGGRKALLPLTTLTRLNYLFCEDSLTEPQLAQGAHEYNPLELQNLAADGEPSDLWQQLLRICKVQIETPRTPSVQELHG